MANFIDLTGQKLSSFTVISRADNDSLGRVRWNCKCECGNEVIIRSSCLNNGHTRSCGCYNFKHGKIYTRIKIWCGIKQRCYNPKASGYEDYGGRGIVVYKPWIDDFNLFYDWAINNGYSDKLVIDRLNNDGNYEPSNCQWITQNENSLPWKKRIKNTNTSGFVGISILQGKWVARLKYDGKIYRSIPFKNKIEAILERGNMEELYFGEYKTKKEGVLFG